MRAVAISDVSAFLAARPNSTLATRVAKFSVDTVSDALPSVGETCMKINALPLRPSAPWSKDVSLLLR